MDSSCLLYPRKSLFSAQLKPPFRSQAQCSVLLTRTPLATIRLPSKLVHLLLLLPLFHLSSLISWPKAQQRQPLLSLYRLTIPPSTALINPQTVLVFQSPQVTTSTLFPSPSLTQPTPKKPTTPLPLNRYKVTRLSPKFPLPSAHFFPLHHSAESFKWHQVALSSLLASSQRSILPMSSSRSRKVQLFLTHCFSKP